ncbi:MAG TPA: proline--tRNA ligase [Chloroflexi bacterium]|jgi:prolyl-tRNA synthetase|nr:proline--tRNA ligase [Chloroflexota bacterium]HAL25471.1 proline--tRNA ligase [Chloroflexota bacterium]
MRMSRLFGRTLREPPSEAQTPGHQLMLRAAIARPLAAGLYTWLPLGFRVAKKVEQIIREEMDRIGCQEMEMPVLTPAEVWKTTGRWDLLEPITFRTKDHNGREFMVSYTHEEVVHLHAINEILSYRQLPAMVYHFQSKGRDETRPRAGLLRTREFVMKDAYSFDMDQAGLERSYAAQHGAYVRIFRRMSLDAISVESDTGAMGGDVAHEFQVLTEAGEDRLAICSRGDYSANLEKAARKIDDASEPFPKAARSEIATPGTTTIEALQASLKLPASAFLKTLLVKDRDGKPVAVVLPGDRNLNEAKLRKRLGMSDVQFAGDADFARAGGVAGFVGPVGLGAPVLVDTAVVAGRGYVAGANKKDTHLKDVALGRDFTAERADRRVDLHDVIEGDACPTCGAPLAVKRGVEVGNIFAYGTYYSEKMNATYLAEDGTRKLFVGGSYGIGVGRSVQTIIETSHDDKGIIWPFAVAPYEVHVVGLPMNDETVHAAADALVATLEEKGVQVLYDDRDESAGVKFADADLIGIPFRVTVSRRSLQSKSVELKPRASSEAELVPHDIAADRLVDIVRRAREAAAR